MPSTINGTANGNMDEAKKRYILANDMEEIERMMHQHEWLKQSVGGLIRAPIDLDGKKLRILDAATADGIWCSDMHAVLPADATLIGFDIAPELFIPEGVRPSNVDLVTQDLIKPFPADWERSFDLVHQRFILPSFSKEVAHQVLKNLTSAVKPGGWIQLVEPDVTAHISDPEATAFEKFRTISEHIMPNPNPGPMAHEYLKNLGWLDISMETMDVPVGDKHPHPEVGIRGRKNFLGVMGRYMEHCKPETFGMNAEQWRDLPADFEKDTKLYKCAMRQRFIVARRP